MAERYGVLGQVAPAAATDISLFTVEPAAQAVVSTVTVCNTGTTAALFRIAVRPNGEALTARHYVYFDAQIGPSVTVAITIGMTLGDNDVVTVRSSTAGLAFTAFGTLILPDVE